MTTGGELDRRPYIIYCVAIASFALSLRGHFLYDDQWTIIDNGFIRSAANITRFFSESYLRNVPDNNRPLMVLTTMVDYQLFGLHPGGYHFQNMLWHAGCSLLVYHLVKRLWDRRLAFIAALLFAVHPAHVEAVAAINYREDLLATFFILTTMLLCLRARDRRKSAFGLALVSYTAALLSKETALILPLLLFASDAHREGAGRALRQWGRQYVVLGVVALGVTGSLALALHGYASVAAAPTPLTLRLWTEARIVTAYLEQLAIPIHFSPEYFVALTGAGDWRNDLSVVALVVCAVAAVAVRRRAPAVSWGALWLAVALLPTSSIIPLHNLRADRYLYLPSIGFCVALGWALARLDAGRLGWRVQTLAVVVLALLSVRQQLVWHDSLRLWRAAVATAPGSTRAWTGLSFAYAEQSRLREAEDAAERGLALDPNDPKLLMARGICQTERGDFDGGLESFALALGVFNQPGADRARLFDNLGTALERAHRLAEAEEAFRAAIELEPDSARYHDKLATLLGELGQPDEAARESQRARELLPGDSSGAPQLLLGAVH